MHAILGSLVSIGVRIVVFSVLIFFHELGHYLAARWRGIYVEAFSIGFGPALASWTDRVGTVWKISIIPLGGYVKMNGMANSVLEESEVDQAAIRHGEAYFEKSVGSRAIVAAAGPVANFILAAVLFVGLFGMIGLEEPIPDPVAGQLVAGDQADQAGIRPGDRFLLVDGQKVASFEEIVTLVHARAGRTIPMVVQRDGHELTIPVAVRREGDIGRIGIENAFKLTKLGPIAAIGTGLEKTWQVLSGTVGGLARLIGSGQGINDVGGPIRMIGIIGQVAHQGFSALVGLTAVLSISLGVFNLLPIPVLDGGHLLFYAIEAVRGRPLPPKAQDYGTRVGFALIASLIVVISLHDLVRAGAFHWLGG